MTELERLKQIELDRFHNSYWYSFISLFSTESSEPGKKKSRVEEAEELEVRKQRVLAAIVGVVAMLSYAYAIGLIKFRFDKFDYEYSEKKI